MDELNQEWSELCEAGQCTESFEDYVATVTCRAQDYAVERGIDSKPKRKPVERINLAEMANDIFRVLSGGR